MGEPRVPELADQLQALVDQLLVDLGVTDLLRAVEELRDEEVLALRRELDDAERRRGGNAGVVEDPGGVVLVLHEASHRLERRLVLESPIEDRSAELVPPIGTNV